MQVSSYEMKTRVLGKKQIFILMFTLSTCSMILKNFLLGGGRNLVLGTKTKISTLGIGYMGVFSTGAMGALAPAILKNRLLTPAIFGHFSTVGKDFGC